MSAQADSALVSGAKGHRFESWIAHRKNRLRKRSVALFSALLLLFSDTT